MLRVPCKCVDSNCAVFHMTKLKLIELDDKRKCNNKCRMRKFECFPGFPLDAVACRAGQGVRHPAGRLLLTVASHLHHQLRHMHISKYAVEKSQTNATSVTLHPHGQRAIEEIFETTSPSVCLLLLLWPTTTTNISCVTCRRGRQHCLFGNTMSREIQS